MVLFSWPALRLESAGMCKGTEGPDLKVGWKVSHYKCWKVIGEVDVRMKEPRLSGPLDLGEYEPLGLAWRRGLVDWELRETNHKARKGNGGRLLTMEWRPALRSNPKEWRNPRRATVPHRLTLTVTSLSRWAV